VYLALMTRYQCLGIILNGIKAKLLNFAHPPDC
jgi:hypothetical protein